MPEILSPARHEGRDVRLRPMLFAAGGMILALAIVLGGAFWLFPHSMSDQFVARPLPQFASPLLQSSPRRDMDVFRAQQMHDLNTVYWIDRDTKLVHLPIEDAMRKVAAEGIADWPAPKQAAR